MAINLDSPSVQTHILAKQGIISRMSSHSAACKTWCMTLVAAIAALGISAESTRIVLVGLLPTLILFVLDAFYLSLERDFREMYDQFVDSLAAGEIDASDLFKMKPPNGLLHRLKATGKAFGSVSVWPFYLLVAAAMVLTVTVSRFVDPPPVIQKGRPNGF